MKAHEVAGPRYQASAAAAELQMKDDWLTLDAFVARPGADGIFSDREFVPSPLSIPSLSFRLCPKSL